jgi:hypothetical protein
MIEDVWMALDILPHFRWRWERKDLNGGHPLIFKLAVLIHSDNVTSNFADQNVLFGMHTKISKQSATNCATNARVMQKRDGCKSTTEAKVQRRQKCDQKVWYNDEGDGSRYVAFAGATAAEKVLKV